MTIDTPREDHIPALRQLWQRAFGDSDEFLDGFFSVGFDPERCRAVSADDETVAALYWFDCRWEDKKVAYLYAVATKPEHQGKGYCAELMKNTHRHLQESGYHGTILVPGSDSLFSLYQKLGYVPCCPADLQTVSAGTEDVFLKQISASAYASAQKKYLPKDCVFHTQSALVFAATFNKFYEGKGFAFCGAPDGVTFFFQSFLGDTTVLPNVLATLGAEQGILRLPGSTPYAMYHSFDGCDLLPPAFEIPLN